MLGLKGLSISQKDNEKAIIKQTNFFIRQTGSFTFYSKIDAIPTALAYDYRIDYGFIANTGKLMPINDPVVTNFFSTNLMILD